MQTEAWSSVLPSIIDAAEREPEIAQLHAILQAGVMDPFFAAVESARSRGKLPQDRDAAVMVAASVGPLFYRRWFSKELIDKAFVAKILQHAMA